MNWKQAWPHYAKGNGRTVCDFTDKPCEEEKEERWKEVRAKKMQDAVKDKEVVTPPRKKVRDEAEEVMKGTRKQKKI